MKIKGTGCKPGQINKGLAKTHRDATKRTGSKNTAFRDGSKTLKLNEEVVHMIRFDPYTNSLSNKTLAKRLNVSPQSIWAVKAFRSWKHVTRKSL